MDKMKIPKSWKKVYSYNNGDYKYKDENEVYHLIRNGKEIAKGVRVYSYNNGDYKYKDRNCVEHLIRNGKEIAKGKWVYSYPNGDYAYKDENRIYHYVEAEEVKDLIKQKSGRELVE